MTYVLDTNIISYMLNGDTEVRARYRQESDKGRVFAIPPVVYYEIYHWLMARNLKRKTEEFNALFRKMEQKDFGWPVWRKAAEIQAALINQGNRIGDADVLIAAYCLLNGYGIVTNNTSEFKRIDGLSIENWV